MSNLLEKKSILSLSFAILIPAIVAIGAYYGTVISPLILICSIVAVVVLFALGKIQGNVVYLYIFGIAWGLILQTTMLGVDVVGSDIHSEFYYAKVNTTQAWDITYPNMNNSSIVVGWIIPFISKIMGLEVLWVMKAIIPMFLALAMVILFATFKKLFNEKVAFFSTIFFMIIPVFSLEIAQIEKSMVAELFLVTMFYALISDWKWYWKFPVISLSLALQIACHYTVGILGVCFLLCVFGFRLLSYVCRWWNIKKTHILVIFVSLIIGMGTFYSYHSYASNGGGWRSISDVIVSYLPQGVKVPLVIQADEATIIQGSYHDIPITVEPVTKVNLTGTLEQKIEQGSSLVKMGVGADFFKSELDGKIFRIIQYLTQFLILCGGAWLLWRYKVPNEYLGLVGGSLVLLILCILVPAIPSIINMSRFYHFSLLFISPLFVLGCEAISNRGKKIIYNDI